MYFKTKGLVTIALFGAIIFVAEYILGIAILAMTGIPASGGLVNILVAVFLFVVGAKIINKFGSITTISTILGVLSIPTLVNGSPGAYKVVLMFAIGLLADYYYCLV